MQKFVKEWQLKKKTLLRAQQDTLIDLNAINYKVERLKEDLIIHEYYANYIDKNLETEVSPADISAYYNKNPSNFVLKEKVVKGLVIKIASDNPLIWKVRRQFGRSDTASYAQLVEMATAQATNYTFSTNEWITFADMIIETPVYQNNNQQERLLSQKQIILTQNENTYLLKITEIKDAGETAPLQLKTQTIRRIILNERKKNLIANLQEKISLTPHN